MKIGDFDIKNGNSVFIIAELSANHNGNIENAFKIIDKAKECGASAVKMQTYTADTITLKSDSDDFKIKGGLWDGKTLYDLYEEAHTPWHWHKELFDYAKGRIEIFSAPFDLESAKMLEEFGVEKFKIASSDLTNRPLLEAVSAMNKKMFLFF